MNQIIKHAKMTFLAQLNPYRSVKKVYANAINTLVKNENIQYVGIKDVKQIPTNLYESLFKTGNYVLHTLDVSSHGGRALDMQLHNPITGKYMSGSSSGTAINVFLGINDIGIGTDGGGSVLAPAICLNLYGFICPILEQEHMKQFEKKSTDDIVFSPSIGFMTKKWKEMQQLLECTHLISNENKKDCAFLALSDIQEKREIGIKTEKICFPDVFGERNDLIIFLKKILVSCDFIIEFEGPIDIEGFGDSIFGHFDLYTKHIQRLSRKGLIRIANMANATAIAVPSKELGCSWVLMCESEHGKIQKMMEQVEKLVLENDSLVTRYFSNIDSYFEEGYGN